MSPKKWELIRSFVFPDPTLEGENLSNNATHPVLDVSQHQLRRQMYETSKKLYAASSSATSSCSLCKSAGDAANCKNLFDKANCKLLVAAEEIYSFLHRSEIFIIAAFTM